MAIQNLTRKTTISSSVTECKTSWQRARGLMFTSRFPKRPLLFRFDLERKWGLHMLFVPYPIDVVFLDGQKRVVDVKESFKPWTFYGSKKACKYIIELREGAIRKSAIRVGDRLSF